MESAYTDVTTVYKNKYKKINESMDYIENISTDIQDHPSPTTDYKYFIYDKMNTTDRLLSEPKHNYSILIRPDRPKKLYVFTISTSFDRTFQKVQRLPVSRVINIAIETNYTYRG